MCAAVTPSETDGTCGHDPAAHTDARAALRRLRAEGKIKIGSVDTLTVDLESLGLEPGSYSTGGVRPTAKPTGTAKPAPRAAGDTQ